MIALLEWAPRQANERRSAVQMEEDRILQMRVCRVRLRRGERTPELLVRRRVDRALRRLQKLGITQVILPEVFPFSDALARFGLKTVSTRALRQALAADWVDALLRGRAGAAVAVRANTLTGEAARTVTELCLRWRYVLLDVPQGGEELGRALRREYGVSLLLERAPERLAAADALVLFDPGLEIEGCGEKAVGLYDGGGPLPPVVLPPMIEEQLPAGADRGQLLSALRASGSLRPGQMTVGRGRT